MELLGPKRFSFFTRNRKRRERQWPLGRGSKTIHKLVAGMKEKRVASFSGREVVAVLERGGVRGEHLKKQIRIHRAHYEGT